jgi:hypothetical protein
VRCSTNGHTTTLPVPESSAVGSALGRLALSEKYVKIQWLPGHNWPVGGNPQRRRITMKSGRFLRIGGFISGGVLILFGIAVSTSS